MVFQGGAVGVALHGGKLINPLLAVEVQLEGGQIDGGDDVPQLSVEGVEVVPVGVDGAQQIQCVAVALGFPQKPKGTGVLRVVQGQDQPVGKAGGLQEGAGPVQGQRAGAVSLNYPQGGKKLHRPGLHILKGVGRRLLIQGVEHAAPGGIDDQGLPLVRIGGHPQQGQLVRRRLGHPIQLLLGDGLRMGAGVELVAEQPHGVAVGNLAPGPVGQLSGLHPGNVAASVGGRGAPALFGKHRSDAPQQPKGQQQRKQSFHCNHPFCGQRPKILFYYNTGQA